MLYYRNVAVTFCCYAVAAECDYPRSSHTRLAACCRRFSKQHVSRRPPAFAVNHIKEHILSWIAKNCIHRCELCSNIAQCYICMPKICNYNLSPLCLLNSIPQRPALLLVITPHPLHLLTCQSRSYVDP